MKPTLPQLCLQATHPSTTAHRQPPPVSGRARSDVGQRGHGLVPQYTSGMKPASARHVSSTAAAVHTQPRTGHTPQRPVRAMSAIVRGQLPASPANAWLESANKYPTRPVASAKPSKPDPYAPSKPQQVNHSKPQQPALRQPTQQPTQQPRQAWQNHKPAPLAPVAEDRQVMPPTEAALRQLPLVDRPSIYRPVPSEAATNAGWWHRQPSSGSNISYPMTAVTDRGSITPSEMVVWESRMSELEKTIKEERLRRQQ